jgi:hypothetical protein
MISTSLLCKSGFVEPVNSVSATACHPEKGHNPGVGKRFPDTDHRLFSDFSTLQRGPQQGKDV